MQLSKSASLNTFAKKIFDKFRYLLKTSRFQEKNVFTFLLDNGLYSIKFVGIFTDSSFNYKKNKEIATIFKVKIPKQIQKLYIMAFFSVSLQKNTFIWIQQFHFGLIPTTFIKHFLSKTIVRLLLFSKDIFFSSLQSSCIHLENRCIKFPSPPKSL